MGSPDCPRDPWTYACADESMCRCRTSSGVAGVNKPHDLVAIFLSPS